MYKVVLIVEGSLPSIPGATPVHWWCKERVPGYNYEGPAALEGPDQHSNIGSFGGTHQICRRQGPGNHAGLVIYTKHVPLIPGLFTSIKDKTKQNKQKPPSGHKRIRHCLAKH